MSPSLTTPRSITRISLLLTTWRPSRVIELLKNFFLVLIACSIEFDDDVVVMSSLQKPRKISIIGSDGKLYSFLAKPKDDLRKDARLMQFNDMIIKLLKKDSESRSRHLSKLWSPLRQCPC